MGTPKKWGWRVVGVLAFFLTQLLITGEPAIAETVMKRAVLGTIVRPGAVEVAHEPDAWTPAGPGAPILENSTLSTGRGVTTLIALGRHGVIGLREQSHLSVGKIDREGLPLALDGDSSLIFRLPLKSDLTVFTYAAVARGPGGVEMPVGDTSIQGIITQDGKKTTVRIISGKLRVRSRDGARFAWVSGGEQATVVAGQEMPQIARMSEAAQEETSKRLGILGFLGSTTGRAVAGVTVVAVGVGLGTAAATGAFSSDDGGDAALTVEGSTAEGSTPQGSPFRP
jgi:hypothetical protein